jgi:thymidylate synthase (FAD)
MTINSEVLFQELNGEFNAGFPSIPSQVFHTSKGIPYLKKPGIACIGRTMTAIDSMQDFLNGFDSSLRFPEYLHDNGISGGRAFLDGADICKIAGQLCYMSFGTNRTWNKDAEKYFNNIKASGHGSVLEAFNITILAYGDSRSLTHEWARHRHLSYSQVSQRYVSGKTLRFVERPEWQADEHLHLRFEDRIDRAAQEYNELTEILLLDQQQGKQLLSAEAKTDLRKKVRQAARSCLPNETEAPIIVTGNARAWRHFLEMRASEHAEIEIRELATRIFLCLYQIDPILFGDYRLEKLQDGTHVVSTEYRKV